MANTTNMDELLDIFDTVMRNPESGRGLRVADTCRLLSREVKARYPADKYGEAMGALEGLYVEQFLHTCLLVPDFATQVQNEMKRFR